MYEYKVISISLLGSLLGPNGLEGDSISWLRRAGGS